MPTCMVKKKMCIKETTKTTKTPRHTIPHSCTNYLTFKPLSNPHTSLYLAFTIETHNIKLI